MAGLEILRRAADARKPLVLAHRGGRALFPENSLLAFRECGKVGAEGVEFDVRACASGEIVVFHDQKVNRLTDGDGFVDEIPWKELRELHLRGPSKELSGERIPLFKEVLGVLPSSFFVNVEIKYERGDPAELAAKVLKELEGSRFLTEGKLVVSSFHPRVLFTCKKIAPQVPLGYLYEPKWRMAALKSLLVPFLKPVTLHPEQSRATEGLAARARRKGRDLAVWTVNDPEAMKRLAANGVAAIITDKPDLARKTVDSLPGAKA